MEGNRGSLIADDIAASWSFHDQRWKLVAVGSVQTQPIRRLWEEWSPREDGTVGL